MSHMMDRLARWRLELGPDHDTVAEIEMVAYILTAVVLSFLTGAWS